MRSKETNMRRSVRLAKGLDSEDPLGKLTGRPVIGDIFFSLSHGFFVNGTRDGEGSSFLVSAHYPDGSEEELNLYLTSDQESDIDQITQKLIKEEYGGGWDSLSHRKL